MKPVLISVLSTMILAGFAALNVVGFDLETAWIERFPKDYNPMHELGSNDRPQPGETNWWVLHVYNNSLETSDISRVTWRINGMPVGSNDLPAVLPQSLMSASNRWIVPGDYTYDFSRPLTNLISAEITAAGDARTNNNLLEVHMDALTFQIGVYTGTFWQYTIPDDMSFYERLNILFARLNRKLGDAVFPRSPHGILDRYRVDTIYISHNKMEGYWYTHTNHSVRSYFSEDTWGGGFYNYPYYFIGHTFKWGNSGIFSIIGMDAFIHEAGHATQLPDIYNFNLQGQFNDVNPGVTVPCDWMDPFGKDDIMRSPYNDEKSVFTEYESIAANLYPGIQRKVTPEMIGGPGGTNFGYIFRDLPQRVEIKLYNNDGRELEGIPVNTYRGSLIMDGSWPNLCFRDDLYHQGTYHNGYTFEPRFVQLESFEGKMTNCFQVAVRGNANEYFHVLDLPHFNYMYWLGQTNTATFVFTNRYETADITSFTINDGETWTESRHVTLAFDITTTPKHMKVANSIDDIPGGEWLPYGNPIGWTLPDVLGWHTVCVQVISFDYVPSEIQTASIELIPEPGLTLIGILIFLAAGKSLRSNELSR
jgi:hypothetical protein